MRDRADGTWFQPWEPIKQGKIHDHSFRPVLLMGPYLRANRECGQRALCASCSDLNLPAKAPYLKPHKKRGQERGSIGHGIDFDVFVLGVSALAKGAQSIERRYAESSREVAIARAAGLAALKC